MRVLVGPFSRICNLAVGCCFLTVSFTFNRICNPVACLYSGRLQICRNGMIMPGGYKSVFAFTVSGEVFPASFSVSVLLLSSKD